MVGDAWCGTHELPVSHLVNQELCKVAFAELHAEFGLSIPAYFDVAIGWAILEVWDAYLCLVTSELATNSPVALMSS